MQMGSAFHALSDTAEDEMYSQSLYKDTRAYVIKHVLSYKVRHCVEMGRSSPFLSRNPPYCKTLPPQEGCGLQYRTVLWVVSYEHTASV